MLVLVLVLALVLALLIMAGKSGVLLWLLVATVVLLVTVLFFGFYHHPWWLALVLLLIVVLFVASVAHMLRLAWLVAILAIVVMTVYGFGHLASVKDASAQTQLLPAPEFTAEVQNNKSVTVKVTDKRFDNPSDATKFDFTAFGPDSDNKEVENFPDRASFNTVLPAPGDYKIVLVVTDKQERKTHKSAQTVTIVDTEASAPATTTAPADGFSQEDINTIDEQVDTGPASEIGDNDTVITETPDVDPTIERGGSAFFCDKRLENRADIHECLTGDSAREVAAQDHVFSAIRKENYGEDEVERARSGACYIALQVKVAAELYGNDAYNNGTVWDGNAWRSVGPNDVLWLCAMKDNHVVFGATLRADCGNPDIVKIRPVREGTPPVGTLPTQAPTTTQAPRTSSAPAPTTSSPPATTPRSTPTPTPTPTPVPKNPSPWTGPDERDAPQGPPPATTPVSTTAAPVTTQSPESEVQDPYTPPSPVTTAYPSWETCQDGNC